MGVENKKIVFTAGGTGGHLFPCTTIAKRMKAEGFEVYLFTDKRGKKFVEQGVYDDVISFPAGAIVGKSKIVKFWSCIKLSFSAYISFIKLLFLGPNLVIGFGGYTTVPVIFSAWLLRKKIVIHSADSVMGVANKFLCKFSDNILTSFENVRGIPENKSKCVIYTGLPLRAEILELAKIKKYSIGENINILITGGSQGSRVLGMGCAQAISKLPAELKKKLKIYHQVRPEHLNEVEEFYAENCPGTEVICKPFFDNMVEIYSETDFFIGRSGASSVLENAILKIPCLFIPLWHKDRQQYLNAEYLEEVGGAQSIDLYAKFHEKMDVVLLRLLNKKTLEMMSENLGNIKVKNGEVEIVNFLLNKLN